MAKNTFISQITKENKPRLESLRDDMKARKDPNFFWPTGTQVYCGRQGSGKTISAVKHLMDLKKRYPRSIVVTNLELSFLAPRKFNTKQDLQHISQRFIPNKEYILFQDVNQLSMALVTINNGFNGVIIVIDEIHTYFNALESKNIPMYVFTEISQQRKQRKLIIGTSQLFMRMAKPLREQCDNLIICKTYVGIFTKQMAYDGMELDQDYSGKLIGNLKKTGWFFHTREIRSAFNTYQKVISGTEQFENITRLEIAPQLPAKKRLGRR